MSEKPTIKVSKIVEAIESNIGLVHFHHGKGVFIYGQDCAVWDIMSLFEHLDIHVENDFDWSAPRPWLKQTEYEHE